MGREVEDDHKYSTGQRSVTFSDMAEVCEVVEEKSARYARMSYGSASISVNQVFKLSWAFCMPFFIVNFLMSFWARSLNQSSTALLAGMSIILTLVFSPLFPAHKYDEFTVTKLVATSFSIGGCALLFGPPAELFSMMSYLIFAMSFVFVTYTLITVKTIHDFMVGDVLLMLGFLGLQSFFLFWTALAAAMAFTDCHFFPKENWLNSVLGGFLIVTVGQTLWVFGAIMSSSLLAVVSLGFLPPLHALAFRKKDSFVLSLISLVLMTISFTSLAVVVINKNKDYLYLFLCSRKREEDRMRCYSVSPKISSKKRRNKTKTPAAGEKYTMGETKK